MKTSTALLYNVNNVARKRIDGMHDATALANGLDCPTCGEPLVDTNPQVIVPTLPPKKHIACPACRFTGYRMA